MYGSILTSVTLRPRASSSAPIDADARPLPSDETTPPVTKMNLVLTLHRRSAMSLPMRGAPPSRRRSCARPAPDPPACRPRSAARRRRPRRPRRCAMPCSSARSCSSRSRTLERRRRRAPASRSRTSRRYAYRPMCRQPERLARRARRRRGRTASGCARSRARGRRGRDDHLHDVRRAPLGLVARAASPASPSAAPASAAMRAASASTIARIEQRQIALDVDQTSASRPRATSARRSVPRRMVRLGHAPPRRPSAATAARDALVVGRDDHARDAARPARRARRRGRSSAARR